MRARTSSNLGLIGSPTVELAALERLKKSPLAYNGKNDVATFSRLFFIGSFSYLQVMKNIHKSLDEFEIRPDPTTCYHGNRQGYDGKNGFSTFSPLFFIRSFSYLQVMMTCIRAQKCS